MDEMDDPRSPGAGHANGTNGAAALDSISPLESGSPGDASASIDEAVRPAQTPAFLSELAHAMQAAADRERERIAAVVAEDASTHVDKVRSRAAIETDELRRLAEEDVTRIEEWSAAEIERVRAEAAQKTTDRRASLEEYLKQHDAIIEAEIEGVDGAVRDYGVTLEQFFAGLSDSNDPSEIVRRAEMLPAPPSLEDVRANARTEAVARFATAVDAETAPGDDGSNDGVPPTEADDSVPDGEATAEADAPAATGTVEAVGDDAGESSSDVEADGVATADRAEASIGDGEQPSDLAVPGPVGVMDRSAGTVSGWPADDHLAIGSTTDHTSAAVRLLRSVAPWTAPVHAGEQPKSSDPD